MTQYEPYIETTIHEFKSNIARYIRKLEDGHHKGVIVKRYNRPVGVFIHYTPPTEEKRQKKRVKEILEE